MTIIKRFFFYLLILITLIVTSLSLLSLIHDLPYWYLKILDFPRLQYLAIAMICLFMLLLINKRWSVSSLMLSLGLLTSITIQVLKLLPYYISEKTVPDAVLELEKQENTVGILIANVLMENRRSSDILQIIEDTDPDMLLLMEIDNWWVTKFQPLKDEYPFFMEYPLNNAYGMALYSKLPLKDPEISFLKHGDVPSFHTKAVLPSNKVFMFHGVHPVAPVPSKKYPDNNGEKEVELIATAKIVETDSLPAIVSGDFNDVSWSHTTRLFQENGNLNNVRIGRGLYNSFSTQSFFLRWPLDHYFVTDDFALLELERLSEFGSDHFPMFAKFVIINH